MRIILMCLICLASTQGAGSPSTNYPEDCKGANGPTQSPRG